MAAGAVDGLWASGVSRADFFVQRVVVAADPPAVRLWRVLAGLEIGFVWVRFCLWGVVV